MPSPTCPHCKKTIRANAKFCNHCGRPISQRQPIVAQRASEASSARVRCPQCGTFNRIGARFCVKCRSDLPKMQTTPEQFTTRRIFAALAGVAAVLLCLIGALAAYNAQGKPTAVVSQPSPAPTPGASVAPPPSVTMTPEPSIAATWQTFSGTGYSLLYPPNWYVYQSNVPERTGMRYDLILSNAPGNRTPQNATPDESARVTVSFLPKASQPLSEWVTQRWAWLDAPLEPATIDDASALIATALSNEPPLWQEFFWIEHRRQYYTIKAYARADAPDALETIKRVMDSFKLIK